MSRVSIDNAVKSEHSRGLASERRRSGWVLRGLEMPNEPKSKSAKALSATDERPVTRREAAFLASQTGVSAEKIAGRPVAELGEILRWRIDPTFLFWRQVCGRVVRQDPVSGVIQGVPNATVHVLDTDCWVLGSFPCEHPLCACYWPLSSHPNMTRPTHTPTH